MSETPVNPPPGDWFAENPTSAAERPLAARMRPRRLSEVVGQDHLLAPGSLLPRLVANRRFGSLLFYGPPGCGKTSLAEAIAAEAGARCVRINAVLSNTAELRDQLALARSRGDGRTVLLIDEIHRFNKAQQDLLLPDVEAGVVRLIGATTHNPGFYVNAPLVSRSHLFRLHPIPPEKAAEVLAQALVDVDRGLGTHRYTAEPSVLLTLARLSDGDLRRALNALEVLALAQPEATHLTEDHLRAFARERQVRYDPDADDHYDCASVFIKSMRGGDPDAAVYWLGRMLAGGEDPRFLARRLIILASEDIGLADSRALTVAVACHDACEAVGLPECEYALVHAVLFLTTCPKSNSVAECRTEMHRVLREEPLLEVPREFRDGHGAASRQAGHGRGYRYSHDYPEAISGQDFLPRPLVLYRPKAAGAEAAIAERLARWKQLKQAQRPSD